MKKYYLQQGKGWDSSLLFYSIFCAFNRRQELIRLVAWASRKNLKNPLKLYQIRLDAEEKRLFTYTIASPRLLKLAYLLFRCNRLIYPTPQYFRCGAAAMYRRKYLTQAA